MNSPGKTNQRKEVNNRSCIVSSVQQNLSVSTYKVTSIDRNKGKIYFYETVKVY